MRRTLGLVGTALMVLTACAGGDSTDPLGASPDPSGPRFWQRSAVAPSRPPTTVAVSSAASDAPPDLVRFDGCASFLGHVRTAATERVTAWGLPGIDGPVTAEPSASEETQADGAPAGRSSEPHSGTNIQEPGVDEPDIVKTDGRILVAIAGGVLQLTDLTGPEPQLASSVDLGPASGHELFLVGVRTMVISRHWEQSGPRTRVRVIDLSDIEEPRPTADFVIDGHHVSARLVGGVARIVVQSSPRILDLATPDDHEGDAGAALAHNRRAVRSAPLDQWLPGIAEIEPSGSSTTMRLAASCAQTHHPTEFSGFDTVTVVTVDPADPRPQPGTAVLATAHTVYGSTEHLYVATSPWSRFDPLVDRVVTSDAVTEIHQFDLGDRASARHLASGAVPGAVLNQWALSEHDGHLRVATTVLAEEESFVFVLRRRDRVLEPTGQVGGLGRGERIFGVRFVEDRGYVVTFRQIDPLYVLDLGDPGRPRQLGELKIRGYSAYLHPIGDGRLLGVGQDATEDGQRTGTQVASFDVADPTAPRQLDKEVFEGATSEVEHDHRAFLHWAPTGMVVIPLSGPGHEDGEWFEGAVVLAVDGGDVVERARITHARDDDDEEPPPNEDDDPFILPIGDDDDDPAEPEPPQSEVPSPAATIRRTLVVDDALYTLSDAGLLVSDLDTFEERAWLPWPTAG